MLRFSRPPCSAKSLETLVKMGVRLGCAPNSPHLASPSVNAATIAELQSQTQHLAPLHQAMGDVHISDSDAAPGEFHVHPLFQFACAGTKVATSRRCTRPWAMCTPPNQTPRQVRVTSICDHPTTVCPAAALIIPVQSTALPPHSTSRHEVAADLLPPCGADA